MPLQLFGTLGNTKLERRLAFKPVAIIEIIVQISSQSLAVLLAFVGWGIWGPICGWGFRAIVQAGALWWVIGSCLMSRF